MTRILIALLLAPLAAHAEIILATWNGVVESPLTPNTVYQLPAAEGGETVTLRLRVRNTGNTSDTITRFSAAGAGFTLERPLPPQTIFAGQFQNATLTFKGDAPASYSANLQMNGFSVLVLITVKAGATLAPQAPCLALGSGGISFGIAVRGQPVRCFFQLRNDTSGPLAINALSVTGPGFTVENTPLPLTLPGGGATSFAVQLDAQARGPITGALRINARDYALEASGEDPLLPQPSIDFGTSAVASNQQRQIRLRLASPAPLTATGFLDLTFQKDSTIAPDDPAVMFLEANARRILFRFTQGQSDATFDGAPFVTLQTGSTAGSIRLSLSGVLSGYTGDPTVTLHMAPMLIVADTIAVTRLPNRLEFGLVGFDNTFSAGPMLFRFYDSAGQQITAAIPADFTTPFRSFFATAGGGSTFKLTVRFPLSGDGSSIAAMEVEISNSAGTLKTTRLPF